MDLGSNPGGAISESRVKAELKVYQKAEFALKAHPAYNPGMVVIHPEGKITDKRYLWRGATDLFGSIDRSDLLDANKELLKRFITDAKIGKTIKKGQKKKVGTLRQVKYFQDLRKLDAYFRKPLDRLTQAEMVHFIEELEEGALLSRKGEPFGLETQVCMKKIIIKFYKWLHNGHKPDIVDWIDTSYEVKDYKAINEHHLSDILVRMTSNTTQNLVRNRALVSFLFDSGARAGELLNVRLHHLTLENGNYKVRLEFSKTKARTVHLPLCTKELADWLAIHPARNEPLAQLFPLSYQAMSNITNRAGETIGWRLTPHSLRHSSCTFYARTLGRYQFCYRYGWSMSSRQPDRYIDKEGLGQEKIVETVQANNVQKLAQELAEVRREMTLLREQRDLLLQADRDEIVKLVDRFSR